MDEFGSYGETGQGSAYIALIGDVVGSRQVKDRAGLQARLREELDALNRQLSDALVDRLVLIRGDEIQGLFRLPEELVEVVVRITEDLFPVQLAYGLGYGVITTDLASEVTQMDGPCFHHARNALEVARKNGLWLTARGFPASTDRILSALFQLMQVARDRWTDRQAQFVRAARGSRQKDVARRFEVSPSVVSESLKAASFAAVREGEIAARALLREFGKSGELALNSASGPNLQVAEGAA